MKNFVQLKLHMKAPALITFRHLVNIFDVFFESVQVGRFFTTVTTNVFELLGSMVFYVTIVALQIR